MAKLKRVSHEPLGSHYRLLGFTRLRSFDKDWADLGLDDDDLRELEMLIIGHPEAGAVMDGTGGLRKIRFASSKGNKGKSGSARVGYALFPEWGRVFLVVVFGKGDKDNLNDAECNAIKKLLVEYRASLKAGGGRS